MEELIKKLDLNSNIKILDKNYIVKTKTWYATKEDSSTEYIKCELSDHKVLVIIPDEKYMYLGKVIEKFSFTRINENTIQYENKEFTKTGEGHQYIKSIEFGNVDEVEGECIFEDYEYKNEVISLGILTKEKVRADVYATVLTMKDIVVNE